MKMKSALIIGGGNGIGLAVALELSNSCNKVLIIDRKKPQIELPENVKVIEVNLLASEYSWLNACDDINILISVP